MAIKEVQPIHLFGFLNKAGVLDIDKINPNTLTTLTILIAESNPKEKEKIIKLILTIIEKRDD